MFSKNTLSSIIKKKKKKLFLVEQKTFLKSSFQISP